MKNPRRCNCGVMKTPTFIGQARGRRARVTEVHHLVLLSPRFKAAIPAKPVAPTTTGRTEARRLAELHRIGLDDEWATDRRIWVYPPDGFCEDGEMPNDPFDEHYHDSWQDALKAVQTYANLVKQRGNLTPVAISA